MEKLVESITFLIGWMIIQDRDFDQQDQVITVDGNSNHIDFQIHIQFKEGKIHSIAEKN